MTLLSPQLSNALQLIGRLLCYPEADTAQSADQLCRELQDVAAETESDLGDALAGAEAFREFMRQADIRDVEEAYTRAFDINPACALEIGWHLFGEEYIRGLFMVRMREELRKYGIPETVELPDHIAHVLAVTTAMPPDEATRFVCACLLPAVKKMNAAIAKHETPYRNIVRCLEATLACQWGTAFEDAQRESQAACATPSGQADPLHAFPITDVPGDCDGCGRIAEDAVPGNAIPRETELPRLQRLGDQPLRQSIAEKTTEPRDSDHPSFPVATNRDE